MAKKGLIRNTYYSFWKSWGLSHENLVYLCRRDKGLVWSAGSPWRALRIFEIGEDIGQLRLKPLQPYQRMWSRYSRSAHCNQRESPHDFEKCDGVPEGIAWLGPAKMSTLILPSIADHWEEHGNFLPRKFDSARPTAFLQKSSLRRKHEELGILGTAPEYPMTLVVGVTYPYET